MSNKILFIIITRIALCAGYNVICKTKMHHHQIHFVHKMNLFAVNPNKSQRLFSGKNMFTEEPRRIRQFNSSVISQSLSSRGEIT